MAKDIRAEHRRFLKLCRSSSADVIREALQNGADPNAQGRNGETPLTLAIEHNGIKAVQTLIDFGADINAADNGSGHTPLMTAFYSNRLKAAKLLLELGAGRDDDGSLCIDALICASALDIDMFGNMLDEIKGSDDAEELLSATLTFLSGRRNIGITEMQMLIDAGADVNPKEKYAFTPLIAAVIDGREELVKLLVEAGADVNAAVEGNIEDEYLLPLVSAVDSSYGEGLSITKILLEAGADVNAPCGRAGEEEYALTAAARNMNLPVMELLLSYGADPNLSGWNEEPDEKTVIEQIRERELHRGPEILKRLESITKS